MPQISRGITHAILEHKGEPGSRTKTGDSRRRKGEHLGLIDPEIKRVVQFIDQIIGCFLPLIPILERNKQKPVIRSHGGGEHGKTRGIGHMLHFRIFGKHLFHLSGHSVRALEGCGIGQLYIDHEIAHVLGGNKPAGQKLTHNTGTAAHHNDKKDTNQCPADHYLGNFNIHVGGGVKGFVKQ